MITVDCAKGEFKCIGPMDDILIEFTITIRAILKQLEEMKDKEAAYKMLARLGQIAAKDLDNLMDMTQLSKDVNEAIDDEMEI